MGWIVINLLTVLEYTNSEQRFWNKYNSIIFGLYFKRFSINDMKRSGLYGHVYDISVDYDSIDADDIVDIHEYFMKK